MPPQAPKKKKFVVSRVFVERQVNFNSADAQVILQGFGRLAGAMYRLGISLRAYLPPERVDALSDAVYEELVEPLKKDIADELAQVQALCDGQKLKPLENYSFPIERKLRIFYPRMLDILDIAQALDTLVCRANDLWFNRELTDKQYFELKEKYRNGLLTAARRIRALADKTMEEARNRKNEESADTADVPKGAGETSLETIPASQEEDSPAMAPVVQIAAGK